MDKKQFFTQLHQNLGEKYNLHSNLIATFRYYYFTRKFNSDEMIDQLRKRQLLSRNKRHLSTIKRNNLINFLINITKEQWEDIIQKTKFDK